jgi:hypothetical protein
LTSTQHCLDQRSWDGGRRPGQCAEFTGDLHGEELDRAADGEHDRRRNQWRRRSGSWERGEELPLKGLPPLELVEVPALKVKQRVVATVATLLLRWLCEGETGEETEREERNCISVRGLGESGGVQKGHREGSNRSAGVLQVVEATSNDKKRATWTARPSS